MRLLPAWIAVVFASGCGGTAVDTKPSPPLGSSSPVGSPQPQLELQIDPPPQPDEAKDATDKFAEFARATVKQYAQVLVGETRTSQTKTGATFLYKISEVKVRDTDVRKSDSLSTPIVGQIDVEVSWTLESVTGFPRDLVPASAESPSKLVRLDCVWRDRSWKLKSSDEVVKALNAAP